MTDVALKEYLEGLISSLEKQDTAHWASHTREHVLLKEAIDVAYQVLSTRLETMNEFRAQITSERGTYVTKAVYEERHENLKTQLNKLEIKNSNLDGKLWMLGAGLTGLTIVLNLLFQWYRPH